MKENVLLKGFGRIHLAWISSPLKASLFALAYFVLVVISSILLGNAWRFSIPEEQTYPGFLQTHWGPLFLIVLPLSTFLISFYFRMLDTALLSIDKIVKPKSRSIPKFSLWLGNHFRYSWGTWICPLSVCLSIVLTLFTDGRDILAPLQSPVITPQVTDWTSVAYKLNPDKWFWYLGFNFLAFGMQAFLGYCGFVLVILNTYLFNAFVQYGLKGKESKSSVNALITEDDKVHYKVVWQYSDKTGRCGLSDLDRVFAIYVVLLFLGIGISICSVVANKATTGLDLGSAVLTIGCLFLLPFALLWILVPYWAKFPKVLPSSYQDKGYPTPQPWPFGAEKLCWVAIAGSFTAWVFLAKLAWDIVKKFIIGIET